MVVCALARLCSSQPAVHVATASASHRNEWHAPGSTGHGTMPTMPDTPSVPHAACALCWMCCAIMSCLRNDNRETDISFMNLLYSLCLSWMKCSWRTTVSFTCFFQATLLSYPLCLCFIKWITGEALRWQDNYPKSCFHWNCNQASGRLSHP